MTARTISFFNAETHDLEEVDVNYEVHENRVVVSDNDKVPDMVLHQCPYESLVSDGACMLPVDVAREKAVDSYMQYLSVRENFTLEDPEYSCQDEEHYNCIWSSCMQHELNNKLLKPGILAAEMDYDE